MLTLPARPARRTAWHSVMPSAMPPVTGGAPGSGPPGLTEAAGIGAPARSPATEPADRSAGSVAGDLAGAPLPAASVNPGGPEPGAPPVTGGIALGMTECQAVRRAGLAGNVNIGAGDRGERKVVLTYL